MNYYSTCAPSVHPTTTAALVKVESGGNPYAIHNNTLKRSYRPRSKKDAIELSSALIRSGHSIDIGLMQINSKWVIDYNLPIERLFEACYNIAIGGKILTDNYQRYATSTRTRNETLRMALSAYNTGHPYRGAQYASKVISALYKY